MNLNDLNNPETRKAIIELFNHPEKWNSLDVNYHPPRVHRMYIDQGEYRINLHKIYPCTKEEALLHPHPWPSIMEVLPGSKYEMGVGYSEGDEANDVKMVFKMVSNTGFQYEMLNIDGWHYVRPIDGCTYTLMITGKPWDRKSPKPTHKLETLHTDYQLELLNYFKQNFKLCKTQIY